MVLQSLRMLAHQRELLGALIVRDVKARYKQTALGVAWAVLQPLLMMTVFNAVFSSMVKSPMPSVPYFIFIFTGLLPWNLLVSGLGFGVSSLVANGSLLTKVKFPREVFPVAAVAANLLDYAVGLVLLLIMLAWKGLGWHLSFSALPLLVSVECLFVLSVVLVLSAINVFYRDMRYVLPFLTMLWMFLTPVFYPTANLSGSVQSLVWWNPMLWLVEMHRDVLLSGRFPGIGEFTSVLAASTVLFMVGYILFKRLEPQFAEVI